MKFQDLINGPLGINFVLSLSRLLPPRAGYQLAEKMGHFLARNRKSAIVQAVRTNQWVVSGCSLNAQELDRLTGDVFTNRGRFLYDYFRNFKQGELLDDIVLFDESFLEVIKHSQQRDKAQLLLMPHFANYDLVAAAAGRRGLTMQVLSYPNPGYSYKKQNEYRNEQGFEITPITVSSLRHALHNLQQEGTVFTGVDRPYGDSPLKPVFFGHPSVLPTGYIRLAIKTGAPYVVTLFNLSPDGRSTVAASEPIPVTRHPDPDQEQLINLYRVLSVVEDLIKSNPAYWLMFYPVWPDLIKLTP